MKLYFIFSMQDDDYYGEACAEGYRHDVSTHPYRIPEHEHERHKSINSFMMYHIFRGELRNESNYNEAPLIEIPDEFVFQFMMMGLQDYDYIVYNYKTKRIFLGSNINRVVYKAAEQPNDSDDDEDNYANVKSSFPYGEDDEEVDGYGDVILDHRIKEEPRRKREHYMVELNSENGYPEIKEIITPYYLDLAMKMYYSMHKIMKSKEPIGFETREMCNHPSPRKQRYRGSSTGYSSKPDIIYREVMKTNTDEFEILYDEWLNDGELYIENKKLRRFDNASSALMRAWYNDSYKIFTEKTDYWENRD